ncbi:zinc finger BED domain-containing protein RICESLEEPER 2 [Tanacetum coccineum]
MTNLLNKLKQNSNKRAKHGRITSGEYERYVQSDFVSHLLTEELAGYDVLGFWKAKESTFPVLSHLALDILSVQATSDHLDATERIQHTSNLENCLDFEAEILEEDVPEHEAIALSNEEVALDEAACEARSNRGEEIYDVTILMMPQMQKTLWTAIKARFGGNEASKKMQKNLLKQQFETFTIGSREELDSAYERFQHILSMLELYDATVSLEDANLKFLRSLPSVWHVKSKAYFKQKVTAEPAHIPKGYTQAISSKVPTAPNCASHSDEIICSFFAQQASMPTTHDDEDLLQIDEDAMEEIDIRWQVAMINKDKKLYEEDRRTH